ncbi:MAG TPA: hypothetical protein VNK05_07510, partial [Chloroflexota bacterium]|nr:hypothetical protein [Chloroflexota bacterium]
MINAALIAALANLLFIIGGGGLLLMGAGAVPTGLLDIGPTPVPFEASSWSSDDLTPVPGAGEEAAALVAVRSGTGTLLSSSDRTATTVA